MESGLTDEVKARSPFPHVLIKLGRTGSPVLGRPVAATFTAEEKGPALKFQCVRHKRGEI